VSTVDVTPDGDSILTGSEDETVLLWDMEGTQIHEYNHPAWVNTVAFSPDGKTFLTGSDDNFARLWDLEGNLLQVFRGHWDWIYTVAFSPDGEKILTVSDDLTFRIWDLEGNQIQVYDEYEFYVNNATFSEDGKKILTGSEDMTARIWDLEGNLLQIFRGHNCQVSSVAFHPDGKRIITGSCDKTVRIWNLKQTLEEFQQSDEYAGLTILQKLEYGILTFEDILSSDNEEDLYDATYFYNLELQNVGVEERIDNFKKAIKLAQKALTLNRSADHLLVLHHSFSALQELEPEVNIPTVIENIHDELLNFDTQEDLLRGAKYYYDLSNERENDSLQAIDIEKSISIYEKLLDKYPEANVKAELSTCYNNLSLYQLFQGEFELALTSAKRILELKEEEIYYTKLALAYLFNGQFGEAYTIIEEHKGNMVSDITFIDYVFETLAELENAGITHPDVERLKGVLLPDE
jgi:tetratricopeptide (TPR) repeat protein